MPFARRSIAILLVLSFLTSSASAAPEPENPCLKIAAGLVVLTGLAASGVVMVKQVREVTDDEKESALQDELSSALRYARGPLSDRDEYADYWWKQKKSGRVPLAFYDWAKAKWEAELRSELAKPGVDRQRDEKGYRAYFLEVRESNAKPMTVAEWRGQPAEFHRAAEYREKSAEVAKEIPAAFGLDKWDLTARSNLEKLYKEYYLRLPAGEKPLSVSQWRDEQRKSWQADYERDLLEAPKQLVFDRERYRKYWMEQKQRGETPLPPAPWSRTK